MEPLVVGADMNLPVLDCDCMGRAFPELQMCTDFIYGENAYPCAVGDATGCAMVCASVDSAKRAENLFRGICVEMG